MALYHFPTNFKGSIYTQGEFALAALIQKVATEIKPLTKDGNPAGRGELGIGRDKIVVEYLESGLVCTIRGSFQTDPVQGYQIQVSTTVVGATLCLHESVANLSADLTAAAKVMTHVEEILVGFTKL